MSSKGSDAAFPRWLPMVFFVLGAAWLVLAVVTGSLLSWRSALGLMWIVLGVVTGSQQRNDRS